MESSTVDGVAVDVLHQWFLDSPVPFCCTEKKKQNTVIPKELLFSFIKELK